MNETQFAGYIKPADRVNYAVIKAQIVTEKGNTYLKRELQDAEDEEEAPFTLVSFNTHLVQLWANDLQTALGKLSADNEAEVAQLPEKRRMVKYAGKVDYTFPEPMYRTWGSDGEHTIFQNGMPIKVPHRKGDIVTDGFLVPKTYTGTRVLVKFKKQDSDMFTEGYDYVTACADARRQFVAVSQYNNGGTAQIAQVQQMQPVGQQQQAQIPTAPTMPGITPTATQQPTAPTQTPVAGI